jgi:toxin ParE1/3/4
MKTYRVRFDPRATRDIERLGDYLVEVASPHRAKAYVGRVRQACLQLRNFPERGTTRSDFGPGLRVIGFEGRATIVFRVTGDEVHIVGVFYGGRDIAARFADDDPDPG